MPLEFQSLCPIWGHVASNCDMRLLAQLLGLNFAVWFLFAAAKC